MAWFYVFRSIEPIFRSIKNRIESFLKPLFLMCFSLFKLFKNTFSLYSIGPRLLARFLSFSSKNFARFFSSKADKTFLPFILHLFSCFMHFGENFGPWRIWGFWCFKPFLSQLIIGFLLWDTIKLFLVNWFDQFGEIEISRAWKYPI